MLFSNLKSSLASTLGGIDVLDIFSLGQSTLVGTQSLLGEFVNALVGSGSTGLDHIQNTALIGAQSNNLASNFTAEKGSL